MKKLFVLGLVSLLVACGGKEEQKTTKANDTATPAATGPTDKAALTEEAKAAIKLYGGNLKEQLQMAMQTGGPVNALTVCNTQAPEIAKSVGESQSLQVSRVSLRNRNPTTGVPNEWQTQVLNDFEARKVKGEAIESLVYSEMVKQGDKQEFRFMKAIPTEAVCLTCHGTEISPAVLTRVNQLYPQDKAIGFKEGDLRGAFVVVKNLP
ncbi:MAG TPA: DUF3365 domain-containing protein [Thiolinea sp.]|nr:DUF3365 domain-containing protein [Thiolinea sp.]